MKFIKLSILTFLAILISLFFLRIYNNVYPEFYVSTSNENLDYLISKYSMNLDYITNVIGNDSRSEYYSTSSILYKKSIFSDKENIGIKLLTRFEDSDIYFISNYYITSIEIPFYILKYEINKSFTLDFNNISVDIETNRYNLIYYICYKFYFNGYCYNGYISIEKKSGNFQFSSQQEHNEMTKEILTNLFPFLLI